VRLIPGAEQGTYKEVPCHFNGLVVGDCSPRYSSPLAGVAVAGSASAALQDRSDSRRGKAIVGKDDDAPTDPIIQPPGVAANQSRRKGDQQLGGRGSDVLVGRLGPDSDRRSG
jgi:hypothetical protein